jgi:isopenicillin N synthase-like dioxygenase
MTTLEVPVIDLGGARHAAGRARVAAAIDEALHTVGFMAVTGHGVDPALQARMFAAMGEFFAQPVATKLLATSPTSRGYARLGATAQSLAHEDDALADLAETFNAGPDPVPDTEYHRRAAALFPANVWPAAPADLRDVWVRYLAAMQDLTDRIMGLMAVALGLDERFFAPLIDRPTHSITVNHYPPLESEPEDGRFRAGAHTDYGTITLLATDGVPGLQLQDGAGEWCHVDPVAGAFHVNTGDMLSYWSGGHWKSTWHRVMPPPGGPPYPGRTSIAYFHSPIADTVVSPLPGLRGGEDVAPVIAGEYLLAKINRYYSAAS